MSNGMESEILENSQTQEEPVICIKVGKDETNELLLGGVNSEQTSAATTPLERSQEVAPELEEIKEWNALVNLLPRIPVKAQRGLQTLDLKLTCISTITGSEEILVIGTNVGIVYWYNRRTDALDRLRCEGVNAVTSLSCISTVDYMVAAGNQAGIVTIFQIPREPSHDPQDSSGASAADFYERKTKKSQRFLIQDLHKGAVTALEWSRNGMKLFSGDQTGHVVLTDIDYDLVQIRSLVLICENYEIVQLSYARKNLLICSTFRSIVYSLEKRTFDKVGSLERKIMGKFGGLIISSAWEESPKVYSVRPGARLWVANLSGVVQHTIKFKELIVSGVEPEIPVIKPLKTRRPLTSDVQFTRVFRFMKDYLVTYHKNILHVIDARNTVVLGTCLDLRSILDVAVNKDEIFILESSRNVIRLSAKPDKFASIPSNRLLASYISNGSPISNDGSTSSGYQPPYDDFSSGIKNIPDIMSASISDFRFPQEPINFLTSKFKETSTKVINSTLINTIKTAMEADVDIEDGQKLVGEAAPSPAHVAMALEDGFYASPDGLQSPPDLSELIIVQEPERFQKITNLPFEDVVVEMKSRKARKTAGRRKGKSRNKNASDIASTSTGDNIAAISDIASDSMSVSSAFSNTSGSDNNVSTRGGGDCRASSSASSSARKLSFKSDVTLSSSNSGSEGVPPSAVAHPKDQFGMPLSLSQSWTVGTLFQNKSVTKEELHLKEELLARRLKWPELLPDSILPDALFDELPGNEENHCWQVNLPHKRSEREDRSSICTLVGPRFNSDGEEDTDSKTLSMENGSSLGTVVEKEVTRGEDQRDSDNISKLGTNESSDSSDEDRYYMDIYTRYNNKDSLANTDSFNSMLSFGPPSGSSYVSAGVSSANAISNSNNNAQQQVNGIDNNNVEAASSSKKENCCKDEMSDSKELSMNTITSASTSSTVEEVDSIVESKVVTDEYWRRWRLPGAIVQITMCERYIICVGCKGIVYFTQLDTVNLQWKSTNYSASAMAASPCGSVVWRIYKGDLYSLTNPSGSGPVNDRGEQWSKLSQKKDVASASVQKCFGWVVKCDGSLEFCTGMLQTQLVPYFEKVYTPWPIQEVACCGHKLWALTVDGRIVLRTGTSSLNPKGVDWVELNWSVNNVPPACSISCGEIREDGVASVWFADAGANLYFTFDERDSKGAWTPWKVSISNCVIYPQVQMKLLSSLKEHVSKSLKSLVQAKSVLALCSSKSSVWFATAESSVLFGNRNSITGHCWKPLRIDRGIVIPSSWKSIYANSIYQGHGNLWISDSKGYLFYAPLAGGKLQQIDLPIFANGQVIAVAPAPEALWVLSSSGDIYGRCGINSSDPVGKEWRQISLSTLKSTQFVHISCGSEVVWAVDDKGAVYMRVGSLRPPGVQDMSPAWNKVESSACCKGFYTKVYVGAGDNMVWALDNDKRVYVRQAVFPDYPIGTGWLLVKGIDAVTLSISDTAVWALSSSGDIYRRHGISKTNFVGDYWRKVPGSASAITVSLCDELWALSSDGYLLKHSKNVMELKGWETEGGSSSRSPSRIVLDEEDEDWEIVDNPGF